jgi:quercetin dioxygenase-like cupin family protein
MESMSPQASAQPIAIGPGGGPTVQGPAGGPLTFKARGEQTDGSLTAFENEIAPGDGPPQHLHEAQDESWYVLAGELRFKLGEQMHTAGAGSFLFAPRGTPHSFKNVGAEPARILVLFTPAGMEPFFDRFAELETATPDSFRELGGEVGMRVVGPPLETRD